MNTRDRDEMIARIEQSPIMGPEETHLCVFLAQHGEKNAEDRVVAGHMRMVLSIARKYHRGDMDLRDLVQAGAMGLHEAIDKYDDSTGAKFSSMAYFWIRLRVQREIAAMKDQVRLPIGVQDRQARIARAIDKYRRGNGGQEPSVEWLAAETKSTPKQVGYDVAAGVPVVPLDPMTAIGDEDVGLAPIDMETDGQMTPEEKMVSEETKQAIQDALECIPPEYASVLTLRYWEGASVEEIAKEYDVPVEEVIDIEREALATMRAIRAIRAMRE